MNKSFCENIFKNFLFLPISRRGWSIGRALHLGLLPRLAAVRADVDPDDRISAAGISVTFNENRSGVSGNFETRSGFRLADGARHGHALNGGKFRIVRILGDSRTQTFIIFLLPMGFAFFV